MSTDRDISEKPTYKKMQIFTHFRWSSAVDNSESAEVNAIKFLHNFRIQ